MLQPYIESTTVLSDMHKYLLVSRISTDGKARNHCQDVDHCQDEDNCQYPPWDRPHRDPSQMEMSTQMIKTSGLPSLASQTFFVGGACGKGKRTSGNSCQHSAMTLPRFWQNHNPNCHVVCIKSLPIIMIWCAVRMRRM